MRLTDKGYKVFPELVPAELCEAVVQDITTHVGDDYALLSSTFGTIEMYHYQSMWNIRQYPAIYEVFAELLEDCNLWVSIDRVCCKPPIDATPRVCEGFIHWDINPNESPRPRAFQGLVALRDADEHMGGFQCCPSLYKGLTAWLAKQPTGKALSPHFSLENELVCDIVRDPKNFAVTSMIGKWPIERVPLKRGDLLVWDSFLPHGSGPNMGDRVRYAQYVTMFPAGDDRLRNERIKCWDENAPPSGWSFPGDPRLIEQKKQPARLSGLGQLLLGIHPWSHFGQITAKQRLAILAEEGKCTL